MLLLLLSPSCPHRLDRIVLLFVVFYYYYLSLSTTTTVVVDAFVVDAFSPVYSPTTTTTTTTTTAWATTSSSKTPTLEERVDKLQQTFQQQQDAILQTCTVRVGICSNSNNSNNKNHRLGLFATRRIQQGTVLWAQAYNNDDKYMLTANKARQRFKDVLLSKDFECWTGEAGLIALLLLSELNNNNNNNNNNNHNNEEAWIQAWLQALPGPDEMVHHPYLWSEQDQEVLQSSTTNKIYTRLDDIQDDVDWLQTHMFDTNRTRFPSTVQWNNNNNNNNEGGQTIEAFTEQGFRWALAVVQSHSFFLDGTLRLVPVLDMINHDDAAREVETAGVAAFGAVKGVRLVAHKDYEKDEEVFCSYGPKSAADYLLEHGFCPPQSWTTAVAELTFCIDTEDRFRDDKLDILETETYTDEPIDPVQSFDVVSIPGQDSDPDPAMLQFLRLVQLGGMDAFLLESVFRTDVWGFMGYPVSETNERLVIDAIADACTEALEDFKGCPAGGKDELKDVCTRLRESETRALTRTLEFVERDRGALDLKEYYQERRLKDLGLDSEWSPEDDMMGDDLNWDQKRAPGGADYDW